MSSFIEQVLGSVGGEVSEQLGNSAGLSEGQSKGALAVLTPILLSGLKRQHQNYGEKRVDGLLGAMGGGQGEGLLDNLGGLLGGVQEVEKPDVGLAGILGEKAGNEAASAMSEKLGIAKDLAVKLIPVLAPVILAMLMKKGRQNDAPGGKRAGGIAGILDADGDGNVLDDIAGMVLRGSGRQGGILGSVLGAIL